MFGYIKPYKAEMKVCEFDTFKAIYCGLCKQLSHTYGPFASLTLSYDFTFMAAVSIGLSDRCAGFKKCACVANPLKKKACMVPCEDLELCASAAMLMIYYKVKDDIADSGFFRRIGRYMLLPFAAHARKKASRRYPEIDRDIAAFLQKQAELEQKKTASPDQAADPTACALGNIFTALSEDAVQKRVLYRLGYLIGRYVYFADALDDLAEDQQKGGYNPFLQKFAATGESLEEIREYAKQVLNLTMGEIAPAYELLELKRYKSILDNIIYLGLQEEIKVILTKPKKERERDEKSLSA